MPDSQGGPTKWAFSWPPWVEKEATTVCQVHVCSHSEARPQRAWISGDGAFAHSCGFCWEPLSSNTLSLRDFLVRHLIPLAELPPMKGALSAAQSWQLEQKAPTAVHCTLLPSSSSTCPCPGSSEQQAHRPHASNSLAASKPTGQTSHPRSRNCGSPYC